MKDVLFLEPKGNCDNIFYKQLKRNLRHSFAKESLSPKLLSLVASRHREDIPFLFHSSYYRIARSSKAINIVTIHDFMPEMFFGGIKRFYHSWRKKKAIRKADGIICVSDNTRVDLLRYYPEVRKKHIVIIPLGVSKDYFPIGRQENHSDGENPFILFVGRRSYYKNFEFALKVVAGLTKYEFVVAGEPWTEAEQKLLAPLGNRVRLIANPDNEELNKLYNLAFCLFYPSSYEGFGIPVLEAMSAGCPVVALNSSSIPEVANGAALLQNDLDAELFCNAIVSLENELSRNEIVLKGFDNTKRFDWDSQIDKLYAFYEMISSEFASRS